MKLSTLVWVGLGCLALGITPRGSQAQATGTKVPVAQNQVISANPFLLLWGWVNVEYERKISPTTTAGATGSMLSLDDGDEKYKSLNGFVRYYPQGAALTGFYLGGRLGVHQVTDDGDDDHAFGLGVDLGYSWLLGVDRRFYVGIGIGATRLFGGDIDHGSVVLPTVRLVNVGFSF